MRTSNEMDEIEQGLVVKANVLLFLAVYNAGLTLIVLILLLAVYEII